MVYEVYRTLSFKEEMEKLPESEQEKIWNIFNQLKDNPYVGDSLQIKALREKRLGKKRIYYLVYDDLNAVLVVAMSDKKKQQRTIDYILRFINEYRGYLIDLLGDRES
jgi:mRNA-degrading endonuclease RelE of RelBE toxin-antitoxin system